ncbi:MAG: DsrE family protein, partial [Candidatus Competibacteraceae bacterium]|nr:DsrE family protein [Candidatus Competibacteraceae bacterium]
MAEKLLIIMVNTDPKNPSELSSPFFQATVAAAMEYEVEVILTGRSGELAVKGVADNIRLPSDASKTLYNLIQEAHQAGVKFKVCAPILAEWGNEMIPEIEETVGGA